jgi:hypothetical protein
VRSEPLESPCKNTPPRCVAGISWSFESYGTREFDHGKDKHVGFSSREATTLSGAAAQACCLEMSATACWKSSDKEMTTHEMQDGFGVLGVLELAIFCRLPSCQSD